MPRLTWDDIGKRLYETGVSQGVLYPQSNDGSYPLGVAWNGLTAANESPSGAEATKLYADNIQYLTMYSAEELGATIEAYTYPDEFEECDGSAQVATGVTIGQQSRKAFGLSYKTQIGNDIQGNDYGYKIHLLYGCKASPSEKGYQTINDSPDAITLSWELTTTPVAVTGYKPTANLIIDSTKVSVDALKAIEDILYGTASTIARLPLPDEVIAIMGGGGLELVVSAASASATVLGKLVSTLQTGIGIGTSEILGTLAHVTGYTGYSEEEEYQSGHFLALSVVADDADSITVQVVGGPEGPKTPDSNGNAVVRITNIDTETIRVTATSETGGATIKDYAVTALILETE